MLINEFSQNNLLVDFAKSLGKPTAFHWRPVQNLFFLISGNIFDKNYQLYHVFALLIHAGIGFLIFKISYYYFKDEVSSLIPAVFYVIHPAHFTSLFWISGSGTSIGFFFLLWAFYTYLRNKIKHVYILYALSLLASESMLAGFVIFFLHEFLFNGFKEKKTLVTLGAISCVYFIIKIILTPFSTYETYKLEISVATLSTLQFYFLRILGFAEVDGDLMLSIFLLILLVLVFFSFLRQLRENSELKKRSFFAICIIAVGLFPFVLLPYHLGAHYMNISVFGFSLIIALTLSTLRIRRKFPIFIAFVLVSIISVNLIQKDNWIITRSMIAKEYITQIEKSNISENSLIIFNDNEISSSYEAYISLGTGKALDFWFRDKNYESCFTAFENCEALP